MSFTIQKHTKFARQLGLDLDQFDELTNRMVGFLKANGTNTGSLKESFFIYSEILEKSKEVQKRKYITENYELRERGAEIQNLYCIEGKGYLTIKNELKLKVSKTSIANFCRDNNFMKAA